ncbi:MAG: ATP-binding protein [Pirellulales bacterium]|jgi:serine/threonine-protein kinase RsbW|nr:ATP-binding protein [Pirellulales bacterium]
MPEEAWTWSVQQAIPSETGAGKRILEEVLDQLAAQQWGDHDIFGVHLALEEALVNAIRHGNRSDASKRVHVHCKISADRVWVEIRDEGAGFDPRAVPDPTDDENLEVPSGRGIMLMRTFMSRVEYNEQGNCVVMEKHRAASEQQHARES